MTALSLLMLTAPPAQAYEDGKTGSSTTGCTSCHGTSADSNTAITITTKAKTVAPGDVVDMEATVSTSASTREAAGLNVSVDGGTLLARGNTQSSGGEITHLEPTALSGGSTTFVFTWIAPSQEGEVTFYGAGNAVNWDGMTSGDGWNTTTLTVTVDDGCSDLDGDTVTDCAGDCNDEDPDTYPGAVEVCDGEDQDCDGVIDNDAIDATKVFEDADGDGYGNTDIVVEACDGYGYAKVDGDCDDSDPDAYPGAAEIPNDGIDQDCDGEDLVKDTTPIDTGDTGEEGDTGGESDTGGDGGDKNSATCSVVSGMVGAGAVWLGLMGVLRRREGEEE